MHGGHQTVFDAKVVVQDLGDGGEAVRRTRSVGDELHVARVGIEIHAADKHRRIVLGRGGHDDLLCACVDMRLRFFLCQEQARGFDNILSADLPPGEVGGVALGKNGDFAAIDDDAIVVALYFGGKSAVHGVIFQHIGQILGRTEIVDADDLNLGMVKAGAKDHAADAPEAVDTDFNAHRNLLPFILRNISNVWYV